MPSTSLIAINARCTTIQFADCAQPTSTVMKPRSNPRKKRDEPYQGRTLHRSSRVLSGDPSSAVFRASTGFDLPPRRGEMSRRTKKQGRGGEYREERERGAYCLRRVSIFRDFCSMRVMMASRFSSASGYAADEAILPGAGETEVGFSFSVFWPAGPGLLGALL
jgi:hypothetical protein